MRGSGSAAVFALREGKTAYRIRGWNGDPCRFMSEGHAGPTGTRNAAGRDRSCSLRSSTLDIWKPFGYMLETKWLRLGRRERAVLGEHDASKNKPDCGAFAARDQSTP